MQIERAVRAPAAGIPLPYMRRRGTRTPRKVQPTSRRAIANRRRAPARHVASSRRRTHPAAAACRKCVRVALPARAGANRFETCAAPACAVARLDDAYVTGGHVPQLLFYFMRARRGRAHAPDAPRVCSATLRGAPPHTPGSHRSPPKSLQRRQGTAQARLPPHSGGVAPPRAGGASQSSAIRCPQRGCPRKVRQLPLRWHRGTRPNCGVGRANLAAQSLGVMVVCRPSRRGARLRGRCTATVGAPRRVAQGGDQGAQGGRGVRDALHFGLCARTSATPMFGPCSGARRRSAYLSCEGGRDGVRVSFAAACDDPLSVSFGHGLVRVVREASSSKLLSLKASRPTREAVASFACAFSYQEPALHVRDRDMSVYVIFIRQSPSNDFLAVCAPLEFANPDS